MFTAGAFSTYITRYSACVMFMATGDIVVVAFVVAFVVVLVPSSVPGSSVGMSPENGSRRSPDPERPSPDLTPEDSTGSVVGAGAVVGTPGIKLMLSPKENVPAAILS